MNIAQATASTVSELWSNVEPQVRQSETLEEAGQALATALHQQFQESVVLARVFLTVPFLSLPDKVQQFVRALAESKKAASDLRPTTPVLSLLGTHGDEAEWNDRRRSQGHAGIPLISSSFVDAIPMISRLLKELGVPLDWIDSHDSETIKQTMGQSSAAFFVDDASKAADHQGRKIISAQEFVSAYNVKSVFATGAAYPTGQIFVAVVFCRDSVSRDTAEHFLTVAESFRNQTTGLVGSAKIFRNAA